MQQAQLAFTAVFLKSEHGYFGFIQELPGVNAHGRTLEETRESLREMTVVVFDEERRGAEALLKGKEALREDFTIPLGRPRAPALPSK